MHIATLGSGLMTAAIVPHLIRRSHGMVLGGRNAEPAAQPSCALAELSARSTAATTRSSMICGDLLQARHLPTVRRVPLRTRTPGDSRVSTVHAQAHWTPAAGAR